MSDVKQGKVKWFNNTKGYGFIAQPDGEKDLFVHMSSILMEGFKTLKEAMVSSQKIFDMYLDYRIQKDFIGMDMCRKFLEMGFTRARRYANHKDGKKYDDNGNIRPQELDALVSQKEISARIFKSNRDLVTTDEFYQDLRKEWRANETTISKSQGSQITATV